MTRPQSQHYRRLALVGVRLMGVGLVLVSIIQFGAAIYVQGILGAGGEGGHWTMYGVLCLVVAFFLLAADGPIADVIGRGLDGDSGDEPPA